MNKVHNNINSYYSEKVLKYGANPKGVDWNSEEGQFIRFAQLSKVIKQYGFSVNDVGCGYGKYSEYLSQNYKGFSYHGYDLSEKMISSAKKLYKDLSFETIKSLGDICISDYSIASGIFSVKMQHTESEWLSYILETLDYMNQKSLKGFSFNMLTKYSDKEYMRKDLYYADPLFFFDYCKRNFSKEVALLHDYGLYEFTILVRKDI
ncbi:class I SAM-dependent methyltransferase [Francisella philomiragia]|uniref:class I SAM-dependent methyltransferase n=1 Tax=Francisella philomiragia TaxID=28110 RepID=UPI000B587906|nr:class I SAM-dependent methyltransferase [Francisella philomiragia]MBK2094140.1 class I SAM-dependent methyltransferase [Francisella philomiragia]